MNAVQVRALTANDWAAVRRIYQEGIATGLATFETQVPTWEQWHTTHLSVGRVIAHRDGAILGWGALSVVSRRHVYRGVAEVSVYVSAQARQQGVGRAVLNALITASEAHGLWMLQAVILRPNHVSVHLHQSCGFRVVGYRERIGKLGDTWYDTVLMERRSAVVG
jgi:L-amino acid N-acyltransferase YncA